MQHRAKQALAASLLEQAGPGALDPQQPGYAAQLEFNLLPVIVEAQYAEC